LEKLKNIVILEFARENIYFVALKVNLKNVPTLIIQNDRILSDKEAVKNSSKQNVLVCHKQFTSLQTLPNAVESYTLSCGFYVNRE